MTNNLHSPGIRIVSFGYGHGPTPEADLTVDLRRRFRNPHHNPAMKHRTGLDADVYAHVLATPGIESIAAAVAAGALDLLAEIGGPITVATGCVGGRHRAVGVARRVADHIRAAHVAVDLDHRDVHRAVLPS
ncbi:RNase adapter RapZ, partial [Streptomyces sp. SID3343]|uniref:RapZ C-terminal domain-containing protein n=1 Tax=Streptomyces sp. SID3343 TaxID=2690260 RepID=UPI0023514CFE